MRLTIPAGTAIVSRSRSHSYAFSNLAGGLFLGALLLAVAQTVGASDNTGWATGPTLEQRLAMPLRVSWHGTPLARALAGLADAQHVAILRDRRVDPDQHIELTIDGEPLGKAFEHIAAQQKIGYAQFGPVAYFGPHDVASRLRTLAALRLDDARPLPDDVTRKFLMLRNWHWDDLAEPRTLLTGLAAEANVEVKNPERIPHDLWPRTDLPPLSWLDRLTLLTAQFELTYRIGDEGRSIELVDIPEEVLLTRSYAGGRNPSGLARRWAKDLPLAKVSVDEAQIHVTATVDDHERIEHRMRGTPTRKTTVSAGKEVYQLAVENTALDKLVDELAARLELQFQWDRDATKAAGIASDQLVTVKVEDADLDALLKAVFADTGLGYRRQGRKVTVRARD
jgi:hypothetical protein